ncbi:MAG: hypothetical protein GF418_05360 [Chitinivibrionales bacterium]|nr:hypothetical protein [Chitinivibrionales bacterium]MBD3395039.1 hypothetical protein [Chitinivibrionales bacterium]
MKLQRRRTIEGDLVVGWLSFFDVWARLAPRKDKKIFIIGLPKTATTSAHFALQKAGFKAEHFPYRLVNYHNGDLVLNRKDLDYHDVVSDLPVAASVETLVRLYPDAYFVYTNRDKQKWLDSCRRHPWPLECILHADLARKVGRYSDSLVVFRALMNNIQKLKLLHEKVLGSSIFIPEVFSAHYDAYDQKIRRLFKGRRFIELNIADGVDTKERLGEFLDLDMAGSFEHKDCFYTWFFKKLADRAGWDRILGIRREYRERYLARQSPPPLKSYAA